MKIAVINEVSARDKNSFIIEALSKNQAFEVINIGMTSNDDYQPLTYIHTGLMAGIALNLGLVDLVVGGCGTGQGFLISAMQYPSIFCGLIETPLDAWLFGQINGGNCISLALNKGFGWAGDVNLQHIFERLFSQEFGLGYPQARQESQRASRKMLEQISVTSHKSMMQVLEEIDSNITAEVFAHKPFADAIRKECKNKELQSFIINKYLGGGSE